VRHLPLFATLCVLNKDINVLIPAAGARGIKKNQNARPKLYNFLASFHSHSSRCAAAYYTYTITKYKSACASLRCFLFRAREMHGTAWWLQLHARTWPRVIELSFSAIFNWTQVSELKFMCSASHRCTKIYWMHNFLFALDFAHGVVSVAHHEISLLVSMTFWSASCKFKLQSLVLGPVYR